MTCSLDIIIVNWNAGPNLADCLRSVEVAASDGFTIENVIVVDNNSSDNSIELTDDLSLPLRVIRNKRNIGFAAACNLGASGSKSDYLLFLNPDMKLSLESLTVPLKFMELPENSRIGVCGIKLFDESGEPATSCARFPTPLILFGKITGLSKLLPILFKDHFYNEREISHSRFVDQIIGAFFLARTRMFLDLHGFDERFFMYFEEVDFSLRARRKGFKSYLLTEANAIHSGGVCASHAGSNRLYYYLRSRTVYGMKHFTFIENLVLFFLTLVVEPFTRLLSRLGSKSTLEIKEDLAAYGKLVSYLVFQPR